MDKLLRRTLTGVFIVIFILGGFWLHPFTFIVVGLVLTVGALYEYYRLIKNTGANPQKYAGLFTGVLVYVLSVLISSGIIVSDWYLVLIPVVILILVTELFRKQERPFDSVAHTLFAVLYVAVPFSMFPFSAFGHSGLEPIIKHGILVFSPGIVVGFFLLLWTNDSGAYLSGVSFGKHRLMERISPKKSWEGFAGGFILTLLVAWFLSGFLGVVDRKGWMIIAVIISVSGTFGDLFESMLKRSTGVKDSGTILPGHGGFLDRFDSTIISFPLVYLYIAFFG
ncbi:MAG: phosphatidate cytidylyltransferase [Bacteroidales bacterium]